MRLVAFPQSSPATTLAGYLQSQGIACFTQQAEQQYQVILQDESDLEKAQQILQRFIKNPNDKTFQAFAWQSAEPVSLAAGTSDISVKNIVSALWSSPLCAAILVIAGAIHLMVFGFGQYALFDSLYFIPATESSEYWRLLTPTLMHFSALHLIFNLSWWWILGRDVEQRLGLSSLLLLYLVTGLVSNYAQFLVDGPNFGGLSGVVYGLFGFVWWCGWLRPQWGLNLSKPLIGFMLLWLVIGYLDLLWINMANTAHLTGLVSGCLLALLATRVFTKV